MAQATFSIRMDENLKRQFDALCADFGMNATTAFNVFAKAVVREKRIPFEIVASAQIVTLLDGKRAFVSLRESARRDGLLGMSEDEINEEIRLAREDMEGVRKD